LSISLYLFVQATVRPALYPLSLHDALPIWTAVVASGTVRSVTRLLNIRIVTFRDAAGHVWHAPVGKPNVPASLASVVSGVTGLEDRKSTRLNSSHRTISYAVFCLKKKKHK